MISSLPFTPSLFTRTSKRAQNKEPSFDNHRHEPCGFHECTLLTHTDKEAQLGSIKNYSLHLPYSLAGQMSERVWRMISAIPLEVIHSRNDRELSDDKSMLTR